MTHSYIDRKTNILLIHCNLSGDYCPVSKNCQCRDVPTVNTTMLDENISYYGINDTAVNKSVTAVGTFDSLSIQLLCKRKQR